MKVHPTQSDDHDEGPLDGGQRNLSWGAMLAIVALAILVAAAIAYLLIYPFFHLKSR